MRAGGENSMDAPSGGHRSVPPTDSTWAHRQCWHWGGASPSISRQFFGYRTINLNPRGPPQPRTVFFWPTQQHTTPNATPNQRSNGRGSNTHLGLLEGGDVVQLGPDLLELCLDLVHGGGGLMGCFFTPWGGIRNGCSILLIAAACQLNYGTKSNM